MDRAAWGATVHRDTQSETRLKRLSVHAVMHTADGLNSNLAWQTKEESAFLSYLVCLQAP